MMEMLEQIGAEYGLFVALVVYVIWDGRQREIKYIEIINDLSNKFGIVVDIKKEVAFIRNSLEKIKI